MKSLVNAPTNFAHARLAGGPTGSILRAIRGLDWTQPHRALVRGSIAAIELTLENERSACMNLGVRSSLAPREQLERAHVLPGNLRFARQSSETSLRAELSIVSREQFGRAIALLRRGQRRAFASRIARAQDPKPRWTVDLERVRGALERTCWNAQAVVELDGAFEIRPRVHGFAVAVRVDITPDGLRLWREVAPHVPRDGFGETVVDAALRMQGSLRFARLALATDSLCVEARLDPLEIEPRSLEIAATAVATASRASRAQLSLLFESASVAGCYAATLLCPVNPTC